jgi:hypothetical protein
VLGKLGEAIKTLIADLKLTWKQAWDENGRGEKMMEALKQLLTDIIDLMAEFILALDRAWMNADNGKKIFADIMEIITNLAIGFDTIVKAFTEWVKNTDWLNILVEDVRKIFDAVNETSVIWRDKIAPILAGKVEPLMNTIATGFHNILTDIEAIVKGINEGLSSSEGTAMIESLADLAIAWTDMKLSSMNLVLASIAKIDWTNLASCIQRIADAAKGIMVSLTNLFNNSNVQTFLAKIFDVAFTALANAIERISGYISSIVDAINGADWDSLNNALDNIKKALTFGSPEDVGVAIGNFINTALDQVPWKEIGEAIWGSLNDAIHLALGVVETVDFKKLGEDVASFLNDGINTIDFKNLGSLVGDIIGSAISWAGGLLTKLDVEGLITAIGEFTTGVTTALVEAIGKVNFADLGSSLAKLINGLLESVSTGSIFNALNGLARGIATALINLLCGFFLGDSGEAFAKKITDSLGLTLSHVDVANAMREKGLEMARARDAVMKEIMDTYSSSVYNGWSDDEYAENILWSEDQRGAWARLKKAAEDAGYESVQAYIRAVKRGAEDAPESFESEMQAFYDGIDNENAAKAGEDAAERFRSNFEGKLRAQVGSSSEIDSWFAEYTRIYQEQGQTAADEYANSIIAGFAEKSEEFKNAGKTGGEAVAEGVNEAAASNIDFSEDAEQEAANNLLVLASKIQNRQEAEDVGKGIVSGLLHGMSLELPNLVTGLEEGIKTVLGAADTVYTNWKDTTFTTNRDTFLSELTTWIDGTFFLGVTTSVSAIITIVQQSIDSFATNSEIRVANMGASISGTFIGLARAARSWGRDIGSQIAYGMMDTIGMVASAASRIADIIYRYLHFSEPDVGPLKDFHTFMPDMMRLMAEGITQNADKPESAIDKVAQGMAESMSLLGQLNGISNNVDFQMPAMAMGTIMPYSVASGRTQTKEAQQSDLYDTLVSAFTEALNNMKPTENYVYLDGKQIADSTTKWQRRADRAGGK